MSSIESSILQTDSQGGGTQGSAAANRSSFDPDGYRETLDVCVRVVGQELASDKGKADIERARQMLDEIADMIRLDGFLATHDDHDEFLRRLTRIYADGCEQRENGAFAATAAGYAAVIEAVSRKYPGYDYSGSFGQLLEYMTRLFGAHDNSWKIVYKHLRAVPDSILAKQTLKTVCSADIREWFDAGVQNLFSLQNDLVSKLRELTAEADRIDGEIQTRQRRHTELYRRLDPESSGNIVVLEGRILEREISALEVQKGEVLDEKAGRESTLVLIESDIREFEGILREALRSYYIRIV